MIKNEKGITLTALVVTVIVLIVLAGISIVGGTDVIKRVRTESVVTNMIMLKSKSKIYAEEVNSKVWNLSNEEKTTKRPEIFQDEYFMEKLDISQEPGLSEISEEVTNAGYEAYQITYETLDKMGLSDINDGENYVVIYNSADFTKLDILYKQGTDYDGKTYYTLSNLRNQMGE